MLASVDKNGAEGLSLDEWLSYWSGVVNAPQDYAVINWPISDRIDQLLNRDGVISMDERRGFYQMLGIGANHADKFFAAADLVPAEGISREMMNELTDQFLVEDDPAAPGNFFFG